MAPPNKKQFNVLVDESFHVLARLASYNVEGRTASQLVQEAVRSWVAGYDEADWRRVNAIAAGLVDESEREMAMAELERLGRWREHAEKAAASEAAA